MMNSIQNWDLINLFHETFYRFSDYAHHYKLLRIIFWVDKKIMVLEEAACQLIYIDIKLV